MRLSLSLVLVLLVTSSAQADIDEGRRLVELNCSPCHAVGTTGDSPNKAAPPFREVVTRYDPAELEEALAEGITVGHAEMPEFELTPGEIDAVVAYLRSLRKP